MPIQPPAGLNFTRSKKEDGLLQFVAGISMVDISGVLRWSNSLGNFECPTSDEYRDIWENRFDPVFGRVASWNIFSTGAEFLLKGLLLSYEALRRRPQPVRNYPQSLVKADMALWAKDYKKNSQDVMWVPAYGTLAGLLGAPADELRSKVRQKAPANGIKEFEQEWALVTAAYDLLRGSIRNRDAHGYVPNVRNAHQPLRQALLLPAINAVTKWMPYESHFLTQSYNERKELVAAAGGDALRQGADHLD